MQFSDVKEIRSKELLMQKYSEEIERLFFNLKMQKHTSGCRKAHQLKNAKKNIAKLLTAFKPNAK